MVDTAHGKAEQVRALLKTTVSMSECTICCLASDSDHQHLQRAMGRARISPRPLDEFASQCEEWALTSPKRDQMTPWKGVNIMSVPACGGWIGSRAFLLPSIDNLVLPDSGSEVKYCNAALKLASCLAQIQVQADVYSVGTQSSHVAKKLVGLPKTQNPAHRASLLIVDRSVDLVGPLGHADNLAHWIFSRLERQPCSSDVSVCVSFTKGLG